MPFVQLFVPGGSAVRQGEPPLVDAAAQVVARAYSLHPGQVLVQVFETAPGSSPSALAIVRTSQTLLAPAALDELSLLVCDSFGLAPVPLAFSSRATGRAGDVLSSHPARSYTTDRER